MSDRRQEWFNASYLGLEKQGWKQSSDTTIYGRNVCLYRGPNGCKCGVGQIIPDNAPVIAMEVLNQDGSSIKDLAGCCLLSALSLGELSTVEIDFLIEVQEAHDSAMQAYVMKENFTLLAKKYNFSIPSTGEQ